MGGAMRAQTQDFFTTEAQRRREITMVGFMHAIPRPPFV
jgi:hypothetical protein